MAVWCAKIGPETQKIHKSVKRPSFFVVFLIISEGFFNILGPILAHTLPNSNSLNDFASLDTPGGLEGVKVV